MKIYNALLIGVILASLSGCATIGPPSASDDESIRKGQEVVVILRVAAAVGGQPINAVKHFGFRIASVDKGESPQHILFHDSPSSETRRLGWEYLILRAGETYYLSPSLGLSQDGTTTFSLVPDMWFHVPDNRQSIYIGSLSVSCEGKVNYLGVPYVSSCSRLSLVDETESAKSVARDSFPHYSLPSTALVRPLPGLKDSQPPLVAQYSPLGIASSATKTMVTPNWYKRSLGRATGIGDWIDEDMLGSGSIDAMGAWLMMGYLLYLPVGAAIGTVGGAHSESKWQPCMEKLTREMQASDPTTQLGTVLLNALQKRGIGQTVEVPIEKEMIDKARQSGLKGVLQADVQRVTLSECSKRWTFSVDACIRARLFETNTGNLLYDRVFLNSNRNRYPYHSYILPSECRKIEDYCGEEGANILRRELNKAIDASVEEVVRDLSPQTE